MSNTANKKVKMESAREFSPAEKNKIVEKLVTARVGLLLRHPFFGNMATRLRLVDATEWLPTLAVDGRSLFYNNDFVNKLKPKELEFGFAHEILHLVFDHLGRRDGRDPKLSNIAADYAVNQILKDERIGEVPSWIKIFQDNRYRGMSYEQIYNELYDKAEKIDITELGEMFDEHLEDGDDNEGGGDGGDDNNDGTKRRPRLSAEDRKKIRDEIKEAMVSAAQSAGAGKIPAGVQRLIKDFTEPKMNWRQLLRMDIQSLLKSNFSFNRPNRKSQHSGAILPGLVNQETIDICVAIDTSGSISDKQAKEFISEVKGIMDEYQDFNLSLMCFDTRAYNFQQFTSDTADDINSYEIMGGGGTDFDAVWDHLKDNDIVPKKLIMFTDMYPCSSWGDPDYCPTLFVGHGTTSIVAPFGTTIYFDDQN